MFPENRLSSTLVADEYTYPYTLKPPNKRTAYALGGVGIRDASQGLDVQLWTAQIVDDNIILTAPNLTTPILALVGVLGASELSLAFDQNMNPVLAYMQNGTARMYWYDTFVAGYVTTEYPGAITPRVTLDDRRLLQSGTSDVILAYVLNNSLYFRLQRERFITERLLKLNVYARLEQMGMNVKNRIQFQLRPFRV